MTSKRMALVAALALVLSATGAMAKDFYRLSTLGPGSSPYLVMSTFANIVNGRVEDVEVQVNATGAATRHAIEAARGEIEFFMAAPSVFPLMQRGVAMYESVADAPELSKNLRTLFNFPLGAYHVVTYADSGITSLEDLRGKRVFLGPPGGGALRIAQMMVEAATGLKAGEDYESVKLDWNAAAAAFQDRRFDVYFNPTVAPSPVIAQIALTNEIRFLGLSDEQLGSDALKPLLGRPGGMIGTIPAGLYGGNHVNAGDITTLASVVGVGTHAELSDEVAYAFTKAFWEGREEMLAGAPWLAQVSLETAFDEMNIPLHPGALRYYREAGIDVPDSVIAQ